jgi:hypothetical protein
MIGTVKLPDHGKTLDVSRKRIPRYHRNIISGRKVHKAEIDQISH